MATLFVYNHHVNYASRWPQKLLGQAASEPHPRRERYSRRHEFEGDPVSTRLASSQFARIIRGHREVHFPHACVYRLRATEGDQLVFE